MCSLRIKSRHTFHDWEMVTSGLSLSHEGERYPWQSPCWSGVSTWIIHKGQRSTAGSRLGPRFDTWASHEVQAQCYFLSTLMWFHLIHIRCQVSISIYVFISGGHSSVVLWRYGQIYDVTTTFLKANRLKRGIRRSILRFFDTVYLCKPLWPPSSKYVSVTKPTLAYSSQCDLICLTVKEKVCDHVSVTTLSV